MHGSSLRQAIAREASASMNLEDEDAIFYSRIIFYYPFLHRRLLH
jgi:hypothetical protein